MQINLITYFTFPYKAEWSIYVPAALTLSNSCILYLWVLYDFM
jgi:hypothetical protein